MNAITKEEQTALTLPQRAAVALGESANEAKLRELVTKSAGIVTVTNQDGREEAHRAGMVLLKTRTSIEKAADVAVADAKGFVKAVGAKKLELIAITQPEEARVMALRDGWDEQIAAEKAAKIAAERLRVERITDAIAALREDETDAIRICKTAEAVGETLAYCLARPVTVEIFQERHAEALEIRAAVAESIRAVLAERQASEAAALAAEEARKAEAARIEQERQELAKLRADAERVANEQAKERQRLADLAAAQEAEARRVREQAAANLKADRDAQELAMRLAREKSDKDQAERDEAAADTKRQLDEQAAQIAADRKAMEDERAEAVKLIADHAEALIEDAQFDADREVERARLQALTIQHLADGRNTILANAMDALFGDSDSFTIVDINSCDLPPPESCCARDARIDSEVVEVSGHDIIKAVMREFDWSYDEAEKKMKAIDYAAAWQERLAESE